MTAKDAIRPQIRALDLSGITKVVMLGLGNADILPLWFGESDLVTPDFVRDAAAQGLAAGETFYTWQRGTPELRAALSTYTERLYGIDCAADEILIDPDSQPAPCPEAVVDSCARAILAARERDASVMLIYGAHLLRNGAAQILDRVAGQWTL